MRTLLIYKYSELPEEAKAKAIEEVREEMKEYEQHSAFQWAIDDCALFEPPHAEMAALLGDDYYDRNLTADGKYGQFVFKNNRKGIEFDDYFEMIRTGVSKRNLLDTEIRSKVTITDDDIRNYFYNKFVKDSSSPKQFKASIITAQTSNYASPAAARAARSRSRSAAVRSPRRSASALSCSRLRACWG